MYPDNRRGVGELRLREMRSLVRSGMKAGCRFGWMNHSSITTKSGRFSTRIEMRTKSRMRV